MGGRLGASFEKEGGDDPAANARKSGIFWKARRMERVVSRGRVREATEGERNYSMPIRQYFRSFVQKPEYWLHWGKSVPCMFVGGRN